MLLPLMAGRRSREAFAGSILHPRSASNSGNRMKLPTAVFIMASSTDGRFVLLTRAGKDPYWELSKQLSCASHSLNRNVDRLLSSPNIVFPFIGCSAHWPSARMRRWRFRFASQSSGRGPRFRFGRGESQLYQHHRKSGDAIYQLAGPAVFVGDAILR